MKYKWITAILIGTVCFNNYVTAEKEAEVIPASYSTICSASGRGYGITTRGCLWRWEYDVDGHIDIETKKEIMKDVVSVDAATFNSYFIKSDGSLWAWGKNENGEVGDGSFAPRTEPVKVMEDVISVSGGGICVLILKKDGSLWGCGSNEKGQLGIQEKKEYNTPQLIMQGVKKAAAGGSQSVVLKTDGSVWTFGYDPYGALGDGTHDIIRYKPKKIMDGIKDIFADVHCSFAIDAEDRLWFWGSTYPDSLTKVYPKHYTPVLYAEDVKQVSTDSLMHRFSILLKTDGSLWAYGDPNMTEPVQVGDNIIEFPYRISDSKDYFSAVDGGFALKNNGELYLTHISRKKPEPGGNIFSLEKLLDDVRQPEIKIEQYADVAGMPEEIQRAVQCLSAAGIMKGTSETEFSPEKSLTRAEIAAVLLRLCNLPEAEDNGGFADVPEGKWYYHVAGASRRHNILLGYEDNTFRGDEKITKEQLVSLAVRILRQAGKPGGKAAELRYPDAGKISLWALEDVTFAAQAGLIPLTKEAFHPQEAVSRAEAAVIVYQLYNQM